MRLAACVFRRPAASLTRATLCCVGAMQSARSSAETSLGPVRPARTGVRSSCLETPPPGSAAAGSSRCACRDGGRAALAPHLFGKREKNHEFSPTNLIAALAHKEPDRIPFDLGGTVLTSVHVNAYRKLRRNSSACRRRKSSVMDIFQQIADVDDDVRQKLGCDVRNVAPRSSATFKIDSRRRLDMPGYASSTTSGASAGACPRTAASTTTCSTSAGRSDQH